ncbi:NADP-dependent oxidoreductase domain-containing protein [Penicillium alfredii]|uniref:NADP-dependent oxidoreductase domain-containing protein n=1 Tax=Penicillium alfredii TaxID=1506179 RepID=A0A9W9FUI4_9EURO|nr:NADP-dependent oxidoreductase domain-containing protein [Penicillium alfredii]KAJ5105982.1 NADP-dependent oxidoreductase domain-containing protein [Penicillium alfredii]
MADLATKGGYLRRHRQLAPSAAVRVSPLCLGTMTFGGQKLETYGDCSREDAFAVLDQFYSQGGNFIDTASGYQAGHSEMLVGEWMALHQNRDEIVLATKYTTAYMTHQDRIQSNYGGNNAKSMKVSVEQSLRKLQTSYIDLLYVHWWDYTTSIPELMHALNDLVVSGKVIYLGISDTPSWVVAKANQYARCQGLRQFSVYQGMWNAAMRDFERDIIPMCRDEGMGLCPYGVLNQGRFQTKKGFEEREAHNPGRNFIPTSEHDKKVSAVLEDIANAKGVEIFSVALAYVMQKTPYVFPIVGARKVSHIDGSIAGLSVTLTEDEVGQVEKAYPFDHGFPHTFLSGSMFDRSTPRMADKAGDVWLTKGLGTFDWVDQPKAIRPSE